MDDLPEFICPDCDFRFSVIWSNDFERSLMGKAGESVLNYCPSCGENFNYDSYRVECPTPAPTEGP